MKWLPVSGNRGSVTLPTLIKLISYCPRGQHRFSYGVLWNIKGKSKSKNVSRGFIVHFQLKMEHFFLIFSFWLHSNSVHCNNLEADDDDNYIFLQTYIQKLLILFLNATRLFKTMIFSRVVSRGQIILESKEIIYIL